jgi:Circularly permutated YpsA SLOG family
VTLKQIISCGRDGAESGALIGSNHAGLECWGWAPKDIDFSHLHSRDLYGIRLARNYDLARCLEKNIEASEGVLWLGNTDDTLVRRLCHRLPYTRVSYSRSDSQAHSLAAVRWLLYWTARYKVRALCVTGDSEQANCSIGGFAAAVVSMAALEALRVGTLPPDLLTFAQEASEQAEKALAYRKAKDAQRKLEVKVFLAKQLLPRRKLIRRNRLRPR